MWLLHLAECAYIQFIHDLVVVGQLWVEGHGAGFGSGDHNVSYACIFMYVLTMLC